MGFPCGSAGKESTCNAGDLGLIPGLGRSPGGGKGYPLQYSGLENSKDYIVHGVAKIGHDRVTFTFPSNGDTVLITWTCGFQAAMNLCALPTVVSGLAQS